jgi:hypothetical protein
MQALERIEGHSLEGIENWQYVLVKTPSKQISRCAESLGN